ncbi:YdcH family protein [Bradyrhizobium oligotrophicum]|uniref:YdcH family protein n=1 Tax=Bradyrhizobium oligotrophicum TaxID=44255 RepID=UPI003EC10BA8
MAIQAHLVELERKHKVLESELHEALLHPSTDDLRIAELKRRKLMVKDEIERLRQVTTETIH